MRKIKREVKIGSVTIGGHHPIAVQTMLSVPVEDIAGNVAQAKRCEAAGCQILRVTCPTAEDAKCIEAVKKAVDIPIVADIHFDYRAALACAAVGGAAPGWARPTPPPPPRCSSPATGPSASSSPALRAI